MTKSKINDRDVTHFSNSVHTYNAIATLVP